MVLEAGGAGGMTLEPVFDSKACEGFTLLRFRPAG